MRKSTKEMKGITLIALVINVIILLVLAGIGIVTLTGQISQPGKMVTWFGTGGMIH